MSTSLDVITKEIEQIFSIEEHDFKPQCSMGSSKYSGQRDYEPCPFPAMWYARMIQPCCNKVVFFCSNHKERAITTWTLLQDFTCTEHFRIHRNTYKEIIIPPFSKI